MNWIAPELREAVKDVPGALWLDIRIHITRANDLVPSLHINGSPSSNNDMGVEKTEESAQPIDSTITKDGPVSPTEGERIKIYLGRPDLAALVKEEVESAIGPVTVNGVFLFLLA